MNVKGFHKTSLIDYPGEISSVIFTGGCNLRCRFCHNTELAYDNEVVGISETEILTTLEKRKKIIDAVVITGGEPTLRSGLALFLKKLKSLGFKIKLDTNGFSPHVLEQLLDQSLLDYVAVDIKTAPSKYHDLVGSTDSTELVQQTITLLKNKSPDYEVRTTCVPGYVELEDLMEIREWIGKVGKYYLQQFRNENTLDTKLSSCTPHSKEKLHSFREFISSFSDICEIRGI